MLSELVQRAARTARVRVPRLAAPVALLHVLVRALEIVCAVARRPAPITRDVLRIIGRYAWYDAAKARTELGWLPRPLQETIEDTLRWLHDPAAATVDRGTAVP
jgi:dihydroflavonol-4-reductase